MGLVSRKPSTESTARPGPEERLFAFTAARASRADIRADRTVIDENTADPLSSLRLFCIEVFLVFADTFYAAKNHKDRDDRVPSF